MQKVVRIEMTIWNLEPRYSESLCTKKYHNRYIGRSKDELVIIGNWRAQMFDRTKRSRLGGHACGIAEY